MLMQQRVETVGKRKADKIVARHLSSLTCSINDAKAEKQQKRMEKLVRERKIMPLSPRERPRRKTVVDIDYYIPDSENALSSSDDDSSMDLNRILGTHGGVLLSQTLNFLVGLKKMSTGRKQKRIEIPLLGQGMIYFLY